MTDHVQTDLQDRILSIRFNRPEKKNAITLAMYGALADALERAEADPQVRVVLLAGHETCFTSGNDVQDFLERPFEGESSPAFRFIAALSQAHKPLVAAVNGVAVGIGTTILLHCDLVYAGQSARFQLPFVGLGLVPEAGSSLILPRLLGQRRAAELLMLGDPFEAERAAALGIVNAVVDDGAVVEVARRQALRLAAQPPAALRLTKAMMKRYAAPAVQEAIAEEGRHFVERLRSPEAREAFQAFLERRAPDFSQFS